MISKRNILFVLAIALATISTAFAQVSIKNGNYYIPFKDIVYPGGFEPKIERVYNSKTAYQGMFGWGWGTEYEVYLKVAADGSVVVHEYGGGATNHFTPVKFTTSQLKKTIAELTKGAQSLGIAVNDSYKNKLKTDQDFRNKEWERLVKARKVNPRKLKNGDQLVSTAYSYQFITKIKGGYIRKYDSGKIEKFNDDGKLVQITDPNNNWINFAYDKNGNLEKLEDNFHRKMYFSFTNKGLLSEIKGLNNKKALYKYNDLNELVFSQDVDGNETTFKYSSDKRHNLTEIVYKDKASKETSKIEIAYYGKDKFENVKSVKEGDLQTEYDYVYDKPTKGYSGISVDVKDGKGKMITQSKYEYWVKPSSTALGEPWTYKMATTIDGEKSETIYNECCGLPVKISRNGYATEFDYDKKGRVTKKATPYEITELKYDQKAGKVAYVEKYSKRNKKDKEWSSFKYDTKGNLIFAKNSDKKSVKLLYDSNGRIISMIDQAKRKLSFQYNENSKPVEIRDTQLGAITVKYNNSGEVVSVDSKEGRSIASKVTSAFQNLLEIIRPAGVTLSF